MLPPDIINPDGSLKVTTAEPQSALGTTYRGGVAVDKDSNIHVTSLVPGGVFANGFQVTDAGKLSIEYGGSKDQYAMGLPFTFSGRLVCQANQPVSPGDAFVGGIRVGPLGGVYVGSAPWSPSSLFANNEVGAWYDPSDLSTMFQDRAGLTPVTADGQPVGLILDKSKGLVLGPNILSNGDFSAGATGWTTETMWTITGGEAVSSGVGNPSMWSAAISTVAGKWYEITYEVKNRTSGSVIVNTGFGAFTGGETAKVRNSNGFATDILKCTVSNAGLFLYSDHFVGAIDNISVKELPGNHAFQSTAASRPLYKTDGTYHWLQFDGVDDFFEIPAPGIPILGNLAITYGARKSAFSQARIINQQQGSASYNSYEMGWNPNNAPVEQQDWYQGAVAGGVGHSSLGATWTQLLVMTATRNANVIQFRRNGANDGAPSATLPQPVAGGTVTFRLGRRQDNYGSLNGNLYSVIIRGALSTTQEITDTETWVNGKTGAY